MRIDPAITGASLVLLGHFNPSIFQPAWFGWQRLLPDKTVEAADLQTAQSSITAFRADWLELQVVPNRFGITTSQAPFVRLRDLGVRLFGEKLPHTPIHAMGINRQVHFDVKSLQERDRIGRLLAPVEPWGAWGRQLEPDGRHGGMTSLTMTQVNLQDRPCEGEINVTIQPSKMTGNRETGVYIEVNDHYAVKDGGNQNATSMIIRLVEEKFDASLDRAAEIIDHIMSLREK